MPNFVCPSPEGGLDYFKICIFDALTGQSSAVGPDPLEAKYPLHETVLKRVLRFSQEVVYLSNFSVLLSQAAMGASFRFGKSALPMAILSPETDEAIWLYDWRAHTFDLKLLARLGTQMHTEPSKGSQEKLFAIVPRRKQTEWVQNPETPAGRQETSKILSNYRVQFYGFEKLSRFLKDQRLTASICTEEAPALLLALRMAGIMCAAVPLIHGSLLAQGYVAMSRRDLLEAFSVLYEDARNSVSSTIPGIELPGNPEALLGKLAKMRGSLWPARPGPVVRSCGDLVAIDFGCATTRLDFAFGFPKVTGLQANVRGQHFELSVQSVVDSSPWFNPELRSLRGRTLRVAGKAVTDIDAVGAKGDRLLLISCKSILYGEFDLADYKVLRNTASLLDKAVASWATICRFLRENLVGDNYDFSSFTEVIGLVCTPVVLYTPLGAATDKVVDGLYAAVSISELRVWLDGSSLERPRDILGGIRIYRNRFPLM
jgi:hypothetical protein